MEVIEIILYCICTTIRLFVGFMETAVLLRVVVSLFPIEEDAFLPRMLFCLTEPVIMPVRALLSRFGLGGEDAPVDFSPLITMLLLMIIGLFLPQIKL